MEYQSFRYERCWSTSWNGRRKFILIFSLRTGIIKKVLSITRHKKKNRERILMLPKSKLNSIETLVSQALIKMEMKYKKNEKKFGEFK